MIQEDKELLLKDLCARLPYGVIVQVNDGLKGIYNSRLVQVFCDRLSCSVNVCNPLSECICIDSVKPHLRPMSSMTLFERQEYSLVLCDELSTNQYDWLNQHHFDYRGLINRGLAIEVTEDNNLYKD